MTRGNRSNIERRLGDLEESVSEYPEATLSTIMMAQTMGECEDIDKPGLIRCHGEIHRVSQEAYDTLRAADWEKNPEDYEGDRQ